MIYKYITLKNWCDWFNSIFVINVKIVVNHGDSIATNIMLKDDKINSYLICMLIEINVNWCHRF